MKKIVTLISAVLLMASLGYAQENTTEIKEDFKPSTLNQPGKEYPMVNSQGYARFRVEAPDATAVSVSLGLGGTWRDRAPKSRRRLMDGNDRRSAG